MTTTIPEDEDGPPVGADPIARFTAAAVDVGVIKAGDKLDQNLIDLCMRVVDIAATHMDAYPNPDVYEDTMGDVLRAHLYE